MIERSRRAQKEIVSGGQPHFPLVDDPPDQVAQALAEHIDGLYENLVCNMVLNFEHVAKRYGLLQEAHKSQEEHLQVHRTYVD